MRIKNPEDYTLKGFRKSKTKGKMYDAILKHKVTDKNKYIPFGDNQMENFRDRTGLNLYPNLIHGDKERKKKWIARHRKNIKYKFSSAYFSWKYLW